MAAVLAGCGDLLEVTNPNNPDRDRALATPAAVEKLIKDSYITINQGTQQFTSEGALQPQMYVMGMENFGVNANYGMNVRGLLPRTGLDNNRGNQYEIAHFRDFNFLHRAARAAAIGSLATEREGFSLGTQTAVTRARAFALFIQGVAMGYLSLTYTHGAIISKDDDLEAGPPELVDYQTLNAAALDYLDQAAAMVQSDPAIQFDSDWLHTGAAVSGADFVRVVRAYQVRFRAQVARTPAQRAAVDWNRVVSDAQGAITSDLIMQMNPAVGRGVSWLGSHYTGPQWHMLHQFMIFFADNTGAFNAWLAEPSGRELIQTPDNRFPQGATRDAQRLNEGRYIANRTVAQQDAPAPPYAESMYSNIRHRALQAANQVGPFIHITKAEVDLLQAEGHMRKPAPDYAAAAALINTYRTAANLQPISADPNAPAPDCVPRVPAPNAPTTSCATMLEALKWEYRMETAYSGYGNWFLAGRGWGDLPAGTPLDWPVPYQELDARLIPLDFASGQVFRGGAGAPADEAAQGPSTYGLERFAP